MTQTIKQYSENDLKIALLEQSASNISQTLTRIELRLDKMDAKIDSHFLWLLGIIIIGILVPVAPVVQKMLQL